MEMTRRRLLTLAVAGTAGTVAAPALWALVGRSDDAGPPAIRYGVDRCQACGMLIADARFAAAARVNGQARRYDDIGCLLRDARAALAAGAAAWVHDLPSERWVDAAGAWYVRPAGLRTPMGSGLAAYADRDAARAAHPTARVRPFAELLAAGEAGS
ncbi:MAG: nitrous oxide reductase accessory protein NosL [Armatimonadota bacterium]|nr:nitrous oxide reductase accessory protein NosL [Armatimonadota bacterium]MDR7486299.1 nitrous oxide reductase accessory protein NosL [Armatimonadota bacterium]MDR7532274.1 nitrous oxide reductase accessory protein NosL [Armatimonadota bacterium]MDR7537253.1 nitrous oxide reductase accessory protein NosL [Armatimonadota bacterium]